KKRKERKGNKNIFVFFYDVIRLSFESNYAIKECSSCGSLYTFKTVACSKGESAVEDKILVPNPPRIVLGVQGVEPRLMVRIVKDVLFYERNLWKVCLQTVWKMNFSKTSKILPSHPTTIPTLLMLLESQSLSIRTPVKIPHQVLHTLTIAVTSAVSR
ncbi:hypothetical protein Tco_0806733, partial [Tanacetum coccineum]